MTGSRKSVGAWLWPAVGALLCLASGTASGLSTLGGDDAWYQSLAKPPGTPPPGVFGPVWSLLYLMMGVAAGRLFHRRADPAARRACGIFLGQFLLNLAWTPVFFGLQQMAAALVTLVAMGLAVAFLVRSANRVDPPSAWLLAPYLLWLTYAAYLNAGILFLNS